MATASGDKTGRQKPLRYATWPLVLVTALFLFVFWQAFDYFGIMSRLAEWQFTRFHQWYPALTSLIFCALAALVWLIVVAILRRRRKKREGWSALDERDARIRSTGIAATALLILSGFCAALVFAGLIYWWLLPTMASGSARPWEAQGVVREGRTSLAGARIVGPVARYREAIFGIGADQYFAPIGTRADNDAALTLFVELTPGQGRPQLPPNQDGVLRNAALPGELIALYRGAGYKVGAAPAVIFRSDASSSQPTLVFMIEALAAGLISLVFGLLLRRRYRRLFKRANLSQAPSS